jgi:hypothetical protein
LRLGVELSLQDGSCEATTALMNDESGIYQRHDLGGLTGPINPGHHATLAFPDVEGAGRQGIAPIPSDFDRVAMIEPRRRGSGVVVRAESGCVIEVRCHVDFLRTGELPGLELP